MRNLNLVSVKGNSNIDIIMAYTTSHKSDDKKKGIISLKNNKNVSMVSSYENQ